ncbi:MAG: insulinase family protein [Eubacteriales bacterium]|nr:insulinase family protein [Eubacteriales bacterium]
MTVEQLTAYELIQKEQIPELNSTGYLLRHRKTGARVALLSNGDENKVFNIGFRTPPSDSTGVPHIMEHSVLCGSADFPVKDPFVELVKGSLNTFLNAMTYPDKTVYPVASCNDRDFQNLMHVYLDAVFRPNIYREEKIFRQEGWHYELESEDAPLIYNGVVYNEMKGALSSPEDMLDSEIMRTLYPDTPYFHESGGDPIHIPELTYEAFLDFHRKYYHPSNCYLYLYGDMDMAEKLVWIDEHYLSHYEYLPVDSSIGLQKPFAHPTERIVDYPVSEEESDGPQAYLSYSAVVGTSLDADLYLAFQVLEYALLSAPGAPLKKALLDAGIGKDILSSYENGIAQPYFSVIAKHAREEQKDEFLRVVRSTLQEIADRGFDRKALLAGINYYEFRYREADFGNYPRGLMYGLQMFDSWLYDENRPFLHLIALDRFARMRERLPERYFENLIRTWLLDNPHGALLVLRPVAGLEAKRQEELSAALQEQKAGLDEEGRRRLVQETRVLKDYQDEPSPQEDLEKIPMLSREDIRKEASPLVNEELREDGTTVLFQNLFTSGISYIRLLFDAGQVPEELIPYLGLLKYVLGYVDTENYSYGELFNEINCHTGGITPTVNLYGDMREPERFRIMFELRTKTLIPDTDFAFAMLREMIGRTKLDDAKRLYEIVAQVRSRLQMFLTGAGHTAAAVRAMAAFSESAWVNDRMNGVAFYGMIEELEQSFEERKGELAEKLRLVMDYVLRPENLIVSCTSGPEGLEAVRRELPALKAALCTKELPEGGAKAQSDGAETLPGGAACAGSRSALTRRPAGREGIKTPSAVQYVARAGHIGSYTGAYRILKVILSYDYLWIQVRVKGGAYGCMSGFGTYGDSYLVSYRDPNLGSTNEVFERTPDYVEQFDASERDMTKYIIGTISEMDTPRTPSMEGSRSVSAWLTHTTQEDLQRVRDQVLTARPEDIRALADGVRELLAQGSFCAVGNESRIEKDRELFDTTFRLFGA